MTEIDIDADRDDDPHMGCYDCPDDCPRCARCACCGCTVHLPSGVRVIESATGAGGIVRD